MNKAVNAMAEVKVKICGLKRPEDTDMANDLQPEYVGFVFAPSRRQVTVDEAEALCRRLDESILRVGVFVNSPRDRMMDAAERCRLDVLQLHGTESPDACLGFGPGIWKAFAVRSNDVRTQWKDYKVDGYLVDAYHPKKPGGSGRRFDWDLVAGLSREVTLILAGGLTPDNVRAAIAAVQPFAVDVSSGVERGGQKDRALMARFIDEVRRDDTGRAEQ